MLPPVQTSLRGAVVMAESATVTTPPPTPSGEMEQDQLVRADQNNRSSIAGRINNLLLNSRETLRADMATIADLVGSSIGIRRNPAETDSAFAARFVAALATLDEGQRAALQKQLAQALKGLQVQVLLQVLQNQDGPEAALLSAYMEIQRSNRDNLKAQTVVSSYSQNAQSPSSEPAEQAPAPGASTADGLPKGAPAGAQTSISIALQASFAGAKDREETIAKLAAALRQASSGLMPDSQTETETVVAASSLPTADDETQTRAQVRSPTTTTTTTTTTTGATTDNTRNPALGLPVANSGATVTAEATANTLSPAATATTPSAAAIATPGMQPATQPATQATPQTTATPSAFTPDPSSGEADTPVPTASATIAVPEKEAAQRQGINVTTAQTAAAKDTTVSPSLAAQTRSTVDNAPQAGDQQIDKDAIVATALSLKGWVETTAFARQTPTDAKTATDTALFRQMFFTASEPMETAEAIALRALANRPEAAQHAASANARMPDTGEAELQSQSTENATLRTQAVLTLAGAQTVQPPASPQIVFPIAVPLPVGTYLAMQNAPNLDGGDVGVDAIDALSDEEPRKDSNRQHQNGDQPAQDHPPGEDEGAEENSHVRDATAEVVLDEGPDEQLDAGPANNGQAERPLLSAPQDEAMLADTLYWKIADLA
ncbi:hypothetical protein H4S14_003146 [Agrobacterium vitis]|nr:hypothetical protein [Agrobacterium vitis]MBE1439383.1 hypothetical protein [Agrobacterium vitis]